MRRALKLIGLILLAFVAGCSKDPTAPAPTISGSWTYGVRLEDGPGTTVCTLEGTAALSEGVGGNVTGLFYGTQHCVQGSTVVFDGSGVGNVSGTLLNANLTISDGVCLYMLAWKAAEWDGDAECVTSALGGSPQHFVGSAKLTHN